MTAGDRPLDGTRSARGIQPGRSARPHADLANLLGLQRQGRPEAARRPPVGLRGVRDRLDSLGGRMELSSRPGDGTVLRGEVPATAVDGGDQPARADRNTSAAFTRR